MEHIIADREAVREFVQRDCETWTTGFTAYEPYSERVHRTGGFVEKIEARSTSEYAPTLDSLEEVKANEASKVFIERFTVRHEFKNDATFIPTKYDVNYRVTVVFPPGDTFCECEVMWAGDKYRIDLRRTGYRR